MSGVDAEQVRKALLQLADIPSTGTLSADLRAPGDLAVLRLEQRKEPRLDGETRELDGVRRCRAPAERAGHVDVDVARAVGCPSRFVTLNSRSRRLATLAVAT